MSKNKEIWGTITEYKPENSRTILKTDSIVPAIVLALLNETVMMETFKTLPLSEQTDRFPRHSSRLLLHLPDALSYSA